MSVGEDMGEEHKLCLCKVGFLNYFSLLTLWDRLFFDVGEGASSTPPVVTIKMLIIVKCPLGGREHSQLRITYIPSLPNHLGHC